MDISTKTGYALGISDEKEFRLLNYGQITKVECPDDEIYPSSYVKWAYLCWKKIEELIEDFQPDILVIEEVTRSKNALSQKILDFIHFLVAKFIRETGIRNWYVLTGEWRKEVNARMNDLEKKRNKEIKKYKKEHGTKLARDIKTNKVIGAITKKHVSIRKVNELFGIKLKVGQNDTSDAILLCYTYHLRKLRGLYV